MKQRLPHRSWDVPVPVGRSCACIRHRVEEPHARPDQEGFQPRGREGRDDALVSEQVPGCWDQGWVVVDGKEGEDVDE